MVKAKKGKHKKSAPTSSSSTPSSSTTTTATTTTSNVPLNQTNIETLANTLSDAVIATVASTGNKVSLPLDVSKVTADSSSSGQLAVGKKTNKGREDLDDLTWLRECELRHTASGEPFLQLEYQDDDDLIVLLHRFLEESSAGIDIIDAIYQIWQQTVLSTLLTSSAVWKKENVTARDQKNMKETLKSARYKINFILHHLTGSILTSNIKKWVTIRERVVDMCYNTLQLVPRLAESCPHHPTDIRLAIIHFEGKEFLAAVACETWDTLYDHGVSIDPNRFVPVLRRCAMLDILDKDWNMLGGWEDILKGIETKCCTGKCSVIHRLPSDAVLHETTTILRNARNSMQCKFFSVRFMKYTEDQAPQRWKYFPKCSAPACASIETADHPHPYRCHKCWYFHYCSTSCQEYCDNIMGLHRKFCMDTPASKAALCRKETEQLLGRWIGGTSTNSDDSDDDYLVIPVITCHACGTPEDSSETTATATSSSSWTCVVNMRRCVRCQKVSYCSRQCQEWDWRVGGHREICRAIVGGTTSTTLNSSMATIRADNSSAAAAAASSSVNDLN
jgi:MYND finger